MSGFYLNFYVEESAKGKTLLCAFCCLTFLLLLRSSSIVSFPQGKSHFSAKQKKFINAKFSQKFSIFTQTRLYKSEKLKFHDENSRKRNPPTRESNKN